MAKCSEHAMGLTIGLDLGDKHTVGCVLSREGRLGRVDPALLKPVVHRGEQAQRDRELLLECQNPLAAAMRLGAVLLLGLAACAGSQPVGQAPRHIACGDFSKISFHRELPVLHTDRETRRQAERVSWRGTVHAVGAAFPPSGAEIIGISLQPVPVLVLEDGGFSSPPPPGCPGHGCEGKIEMGTRVTLHLTAAGAQAFAETAALLARQDPEPIVGPDLVILVGATPSVAVTVREMPDRKDLPIEPFLGVEPSEIEAFLRMGLGCS